eukprot:g13260.t1
MSIGNAAFTWGWSRAETERLLRAQAVARGWLVRRRVCWIPAKDLEAVLKDVDLRDKGLRRLVAYLCFFLLFFGILIMESDVTLQHSVEMGMTDFINQVTSGPNNDVRLSEVATREDFSAWILSLYLAMYDGTEVEDVCNTCASMRSDTGYVYFPEISGEVWGTEVPLASSASAGGGDGNSSFTFELENCPLCYGDDRASVVGEAGSLGDDFCGICTDLEVCFSGRCADFSEFTPRVSEVKGTNDSLLDVYSNSDCSGGAGDPTVFWGNRGFWLRVGMTSVLAHALLDPDQEVVLQPTGRGYVANRNKVIGTLLMEWTYHKEAECENTYAPDFYGPCYQDEGSFENKLDEVVAAQMNPLVLVEVREGRYGEGLVYSVTTDTGVFNLGLNLNLCGMLAVLGGPNVMTSAVRTVSLRFNTYNGQCDGLFSSVDITAKFTLGGEVHIDKTVHAFSMPYFFDSRPDVVCRAVAMFLFGLMLIRYLVKDLKHAWRELKDGRHRLFISLRKMPITTATVLVFVGDCVFLWNLVLWATAAATASEFELIPTLSYSNASEQVRAFSEELAFVALERWKRDAAAVAGSLFGLARLFIMLRFHPRLSLVTDVVASSAVHLVHFFIMFFMVVAVYSNVVWVIFGPSLSLFATWTASFVTMTRIALGEFDNLYPLMVETNDAAAFIIIATYQTLQGILLLNIVISILLDSFQVIHECNSEKASDTLRQTVMATLGRWRIRLGAVLHPGLWWRRDGGRPRVSPRPKAQVESPAHTKPGWKGRRSSSSSGAGAGGVVAGVPVVPPGMPNSVAPSGPPPPTSATMAGTVKWKADIKSHVWRKGGLTRGQRIALSHRHYDIRAAVEVLRRSPLPETVVWRKMRQIVVARLGWESEGQGNSGTTKQPGAAGKRGR